MASIWKGSLTFGLVHVPVEMKTAVRTDQVSFRMLHAEDLSPIKYERVCQADGEPVPWSEIVKGYEYEKGKYVVLTDDADTGQVLSTADNDFADADDAGFAHRLSKKCIGLVAALRGKEVIRRLEEARIDLVLADEVQNVDRAR